MKTRLTDSKISGKLLSSDNKTSSKYIVFEHVPILNSITESFFQELNGFLIIDKVHGILDKIKLKFDNI